MPAMSQIRKAIIDRLGSIDDLTPYWYEPDEIDAPAVFVMPDTPFLDYQQAYRSGYAQWRFVLTFVVDRIDEEAAQELLDVYVDPDGPVVARLRAEDVGDALDDICHGFVDVTTATNYGEYTRQHTRYLIAQIKVCARA